ncbi:hypothetical protein [Paenibacillus herberti]|uniref:Uncharacterized protein n=1 Tax=Paenibacillus herberti TaxID=1619309 RepID=A0A229P1R8_9BACL|nr:hypothetical protein [Paenibacillus herberti]OXM16203.1 hypothetical protein CGZ75_05785 [Paenibacillus herberti]
MKTKCSTDKLLRLREMEQDCYSACHYLLQNEELAVTAAQQALTELFRSESSLNPEIVKASAIRHSLMLLAESRSAAVCALV